MTITKAITIHAIIDGTPVTRAEVQRWEARRASRVLRKFITRLGPHAVAEIRPGSDPEELLTSEP